MNYSEKGVLVMQDNPDDPGDLPYRIECLQSMKNFPLRSVEEIRQIRDMCNETLEFIEGESND